jgi:hypothetical protein
MQRDLLVLMKSKKLIHLLLVVQAIHSQNLMKNLKRISMEKMLLLVNLYEQHHKNHVTSMKIRNKLLNLIYHTSGQR